MKTFLILNTAEIVKKVSKNRRDRNLYQKINDFIKRGSNCLSPELLAEVQDIINLELDLFNIYCQSQLKKSRNVETINNVQTAV